MADYWKSNDRKYCDFCKCWIADNRPSVEFHEKGRRHQENVKKRLTSISKASARAQKAEEKVDVAIKKMEAAAMAAYRRDVESNSSADLTSISIAKKLKEDNLELSGSTTKIWYEAKSKEGHIYYYNTLTNESVWEPPKEGYLTIEEQTQIRDKRADNQLKELDKQRKMDGLKIARQQQAEAEEERARIEREKLKERRVKEESPPPEYGPIIEPGKNDPYGKWKTVKEEPIVDYQLPVVEGEWTECAVQYEPEPVKKEFKEKTVENIDDCGPASFKKRKKFGGGRNVRQRLDDD